MVNRIPFIAAIMLLSLAFLQRQQIAASPVHSSSQAVLLSAGDEAPCEFAEAILERALTTQMIVPDETPAYRNPAASAPPYKSRLLSPLTVPRVTAKNIILLKLRI